MRTTRFWHYLMLAAPAVLLSIGIYSLVSGRIPGPEMYSAAGAAKVKARPKKAETVSTRETFDAVVDADDAMDAAVTPDLEPGLPPPVVASSPAEGEPSNESVVKRENAVADSKSAKIDGVNQGKCETFEIFGKGPGLARTSEENWGNVLRQFGAAKSGLLEWLRTNKKKLPTETAAIMERQAAGIKIIRPSVIDEVDLTWRGIGVLGRALNGDPVVKVGSGFIELARKYPERARFELARVVAQSWAPCELQRLSAGDAWSPLLRCMGIEETAGCAAGSYSEAGWAVSSALAYLTSDPGCAVPAFANAKWTGCLRDFPLPGEGRVVAGAKQ